jgi:hypothetical protein
MTQTEHIKIFQKAIENKRRINIQLIAEETELEYSYVWRLLYGERGIRETEHAKASISKIKKALLKLYSNIFTETQTTVHQAA